MNWKRLRILGALFILAPTVLAQTAAPSSTTSSSPSTPKAGAWAVTSAPARFIVELDHPDKPAALTWVNVAPPDPTWATTPIRVFTDAGAAVGSSLLWNAPGEPATILFDSSSGSKRYEIYLGSNWPALPLQNSENGVWLESRAGNGKSINSLPEMLAAWNQSTTIKGRAIIDSIFEGGNRFGPQSNIFEHFRGWFEIGKPEHLQLAVISIDASFVLVDGKEVAEWPGLHDFRPGVGGQHQGAIDLTVSLHSIDYYHIHVKTDDTNPLLCCLAAKGGDLGGWTMLRPSTPFFRPTSRAHVVDYGLQVATGSPAPPFALDWVITGQSVIAPDVSNIGLITVQFNCHPRPHSGVISWTFDDGSTAEGQSVQHLFPRPGMRHVQITVKNGDNPPGPLNQTINIHPDWRKLTTYPPQLVPADQADIMARDPALMSIRDLASCVAVFEVFKDRDGLLKILPAVCDKMKQIDDADMPYLKDAALFLARENLSHFAEASRLLQAVIDRCSEANAPASLAALASESRLVLAQLILETSDRTDQARSLLAAVDLAPLSADDHRLFKILQANLALATGDITTAKKLDDSLTPMPSGLDVRSSIRYTAKLDQARVFIERKDFESAENSLAEIAWQSPVEKFSSDWALLRLRLFQEENLTVPAYFWAKRLLPVITDEGRSELLLRLTELSFAQGDKALATKALTELLRKHPYSSEAAEAKEKWPGVVPENK